MPYWLSRSRIGIVPSTSTVCAFGRRALPPLILLVLDLAEDLLQNILEGKQAADGSELVHHDRHVHVRLPELLEQFQPAVSSPE